MRNGVSLKTELALQGALGPIKQGEIVHGDDEVWNDQGDLRVHIIVPNTSLGCGRRTAVENFEWGYRQASVQTLIRKIKQDVDDMRAESKKAAEGGGKGKKVPTFREYVDALWMKVRGPALAKCGMPATMKGLNEQQAMDHFAYGEDERTWGIMDAHNRIVQPMAAQDPSKIVPAKDMVGKRTMLTAKVNEQGDMVVEGGE
ncbi:ATPase [Aureococcus anophagefferens]|nr:ATPase [Aureococcus anophagefferens]